MANVDFEQYKTQDVPDVQFNDWEIPSPPTGGITGNWSDSFSLPAPSGTGKPFPDYAIIDPTDIGNAMKSLSTSFDVGVGALRQIPGVSGIGDILGGIGQTVEKSPVGPELGFLKNFATSWGSDILGAVQRRAGQVLDQYGHVLTDDPWQSIMNTLTLPDRLSKTAMFGETGTKLSQGQFDFSTAPRDVMDSLEIGSIFPLFRGASMLLKGEGALASLGRGFTKPIEDMAFSNAAEKAGQIAGRITLATEGIGLAGEFALPKIAPNEPWARDIMNTRVVAEDSPWRFPFEAATSLPLDLPGLYKLGADSRLSAWAQAKTFGPAPLPSQIVLGNPAINNALKGGIITDKQLNLLDDYAFRQTAEDHIVRAWNETHPGAEATTIKDLPYTQGQAADIVKTTVNRLMDLYGPKQFGEMAADTIMSEFDGWENLTEAEQLQQFTDYADLALNLESKMPGTTVGVARDAINVQRQAPAAFDYLRDAISSGTFSEKTINSMKNRYPAMSDLLDNIGADPVKLEKSLMGIVGGAEDKLPSLRAQLRESTARLTDMSDRLAEIEGEGAVAGNSSWDELMAKYRTEAASAQDLTQQIALAEQPALGTMESTLDRMNARIIAGETNLASERNALLTKIKAARIQQADGVQKQILTLHNALYAREGEAVSAMTHEDQMVLDMEFESMQQQISKLSREYYETQLAGSRWAIEHDSRGPLMRLADDTGNTYTRGERTKAGAVFDKLFSGIPNKKLVFEAQTYIRSELASAGNSTKTVQEFLDSLHEMVDMFSHEFKSGFKASPFGSIYHLPPQLINRAALKAGLLLPEGKTAGEVIFRSMPGPLKIFQNQVVGKALDIPYNSTMHTLTRSMYPALRFYLSPRFLAMNLYESKIIGGALGGAKFFKAPEDKYLMELAHNVAAKDSFSYEAGTVAGKNMAKNVAKLAYTKRPDEMVKAILDTVHAQPEMAKFAAEMGTKDKWYKAVSDLMAERTQIAEYTAGKTTAEKSLADEISTVRANLKGGVGDELMNRSNLQRLEQQFDKAVVDRKVAEAAQAENLRVTDKYQPFLESIKHNEEKMIEGIRQSFVGNPSRSATERVLNSFLLYWPLSYQIKATKVLVEFMTSRAFGFDTGSLGAVAYSHMRQEHQTKMQNDPEYANFFNNNKESLFLLRQLLPITPEDIGVSLSPMLRVPRDVATGKTTAGQAVTRLGTIGPTYDVSLFSRIMSEQTKPGGLFHDLFGGRGD